MTAEAHPAQERGVVVEGLELDLGGRHVRAGGCWIRLSSTEAALLQLLMQHVDEVVSQEEIFAGVWGYDFNGNANVIHTYISYLRRKIPVRHPRIRTIRGRGYMLCAQGDGSSRRGTDRVPVEHEADLPSFSAGPPRFLACSV